jgi:DNA-directed RNA polymerase subunit L
MFKNYQYDPVTQRHSFEIHDVDVSVVNAIRRTILTDIPVVGFMGEEKPSFEIKKNTGPLHNEFLQHRLGLIPLHFTETEVEGFSEESYQFILHVNNTGNMTRNVTTDDFKILYNGKQMTEKDVRRILPHNHITHQPILITRLRPSEELHVEGVPIKSTARVHAGFSPVSLCSYHYMVDASRITPEQNVLEREKTYHANEFGDPTKLVFEMETEGGLNHKYLVSKALEIIQQRIEEWLPQTAEIGRIGTNGVGIDFQFPNEDDTLGNLLQAFMFKKYIRNQALTPSGKKVTYVGYYCPHPLDAKMILKIVIDAEDGSQIGPFVEVMNHSMREVKTLLEEVRVHWNTFIHSSNK